MGTLVSDAGSPAISDPGEDLVRLCAHADVHDQPLAAYVSPEFAGVTIYAQYAMGDTNENKASNDRYAALGAE